MMSSLRHLWNIPNPSEITKEGDIKEMCGIFGYDHLRFKQSIDSRNFGEECFEFDMASNNIKRFERGWEWDCLLYTSPSPRDYAASRMPSSA